MTIGQFATCCSNNSTVPDSPHTPYVLAYTVTANKEETPHIRAVITTPHLLGTAKLTDKLHADGTYKLNWEGLPTIVVGTTDVSRSFRPIAIAVVSTEKEEDDTFVFKAISDTLPKPNKIR